MLPGREGLQRGRGRRSINRILVTPPCRALPCRMTCQRLISILNLTVTILLVVPRQNGGSLLKCESPPEKIKWPPVSEWNFIDLTASKLTPHWDNCTNPKTHLGSVWPNGFWGFYHDPNVGGGSIPPGHPNTLQNLRSLHLFKGNEEPSWASYARMSGSW
jgi:hypothetical protein